VHHEVGADSVKVVEVTPDDPRVDDYRRLTDMGWRLQTEASHGLFLAEGAKVIRRALAAGYRPRSALMEAKWLPGLQDALRDHDVEVLVAPESVLRDVVGFRLHRGALAAFDRRSQPSLAHVVQGARRIVVLESLVDHTNVGLIFRTAAALGFDAALVSPQCADPYYRRSVKTSMGAVLSLPWTVVQPWPEGLAELRGRGFHLAALTPGEGAIDLPSFHLEPEQRVALLVGTEGDGLTTPAMGQCDTLLRIPITSRVDSLNVAAAAAIACYAVGSAQMRL
jgi:tRNA G18 (ribose-2'-O)-methylase SpoU